MLEELSRDKAFHQIVDETIEYLQTLGLINLSSKTDAMVVAVYFLIFGVLLGVKQIHEPDLDLDNYLPEVTTMLGTRMEDIRDAVLTYLQE